MRAMTTRTIDTGTDHLRAEVADGVAVLTMNRPERRNAMSGEMIAGLRAALADCRDRRRRPLRGAHRRRRRLLRRRRREGHGRGQRSRRGGPDVRRARSTASASTSGPPPACSTTCRSRPSPRSPAPAAGAGHVARPGLRPARRGRRRDADHGVRQGRLLGRLRRHVVPHPPRRRRQGPGAVLPLRRVSTRPRPRRLGIVNKVLPADEFAADVGERWPNSWPAGPPSPTATSRTTSTGPSTASWSSAWTMEATHHSALRPDRGPPRGVEGVRREAHPHLPRSLSAADLA